MKTTFCSGCLREQPFDSQWRALWIDSEGRLVISQQERDFERPEAVFACGEGSALALTERYLHSRSFTMAHASEIAIANAAQLPNDLFQDLT